MQKHSKIDITSRENSLLSPAFVPGRFNRKSMSLHLSVSTCGVKPLSIAAIFLSSVPDLFVLFPYRDAFYEFPRTQIDPITQTDKRLAFCCYWLILRTGSRHEYKRALYKYLFIGVIQKCITITMNFRRENLRL